MEPTAQEERKANLSGAVSDLALAIRLALETGCQDPESEGHGWDPTLRLEWWTEGKVACSPKCGKCRTQWRARLTRLGWGDQLIRAVFEKLGAPVTWGKDRETKSMGLEAILLRGGSYSDWRAEKERKNPPPPREKKLMDTVIWVPTLTEEMRRHNEEVDATFDQIAEKRWEVKQAGGDPFSVEMPDLKVYRLQVED